MGVSLYFHNKKKKKKIRSLKLPLNWQFCASESNGFDSKFETATGV